MSVITAANENVSDAVNSVNDAIQSLSKIVIEQCWGTDELSDEYRQKIKKSFQELIEIRDRIK